MTNRSKALVAASGWVVAAFLIYRWMLVRADVRQCQEFLEALTQ